jgi:hypothetical protein
VAGVDALGVPVTATGVGLMLAPVTLNVTSLTVVPAEPTRMVICRTGV